MWRKHTAALCQLKVPRSYLVHLPTNFSLLEHSSCMEKKWFWLHNSNITGPTSCNRLQSIKTDTKVGKKAGLFTGKWEIMLLCYAINCICFATPFFSWKHTKSDARSTIIWYVISTGYSWPCYSKYSANPKATRLTSSWKMRNWGTKRLDDLSETTWKLLSLGLMTSAPEHPSPSLALKYQRPAGQAAQESHFLQRHKGWALTASPTQIPRYLLKVHKSQNQTTASSFWLPSSCSTGRKIQVPFPSSRAPPQLLHRKLLFTPLIAQTMNPVVFCSLG